ncbi:MAG TPA: T9SS type A sorting domain-containing protein [Paludibacter sp.]|nr:T9SS type A sorting domain-containing protein [Paludibacter sp.]
MKTKLLLLCFVLVTSTLYVKSATSDWDGTTRTVWQNGDGTAANPYLIESAANLAYMASDEARTGFGTYLNKYFKLTTDIDLKNYAWTPIYIFIGNYDGNGHKIMGLNVTATNDNGTGLFQQVNGTGTVKNLGIESGTVTGGTTNDFIGGIAGSVNEGGTIDKCYNKATISGKSYVGGIVGQLSGGTVSNCYNRGAITGTTVSVGGVVGRYFWQLCDLSNSYNAGSIVGNTTAGFVGSLVGAFPDALNASSVVANNYYDFDVNSASGFLGIGKEESAYGVDSYTDTNNKTVSVTQKTTAGMKAAAVELGDAYESDSKNINGGYPILTWENTIVSGLIDNEGLDFQISKVNHGISVSSDKFEHISISIYTMTGVEIINKSLKSAEHIRLDPGLYIIKLTNGSQKFVRKVQVF